LRKNTPRRHEGRLDSAGARDLKAIGDYIARENPRAADRIVRRIRDRARDLTDYPLLGRTGRVANSRELVVPSTPFIVVHRVGEDRVEILAVFHGARRWPDSF
jgi:plasmid stabilization system protein ParE